MGNPCLIRWLRVPGSFHFHMVCHVDLCVYIYSLVVKGTITSLVPSSTFREEKGEAKGLSPSKSFIFLFTKYSPRWPEPCYMAILNSSCLKFSTTIFLSSLCFFHCLQERKAREKGDVNGLWKANHGVCHNVQTCHSHFVTVNCVDSMSDC